MYYIYGWAYDGIHHQNETVEEKITMEYKQLLDTSNAIMVAVASAMTNMGLNIPLIWSQMAEAFRSDAKSIVDQMGLKIAGSDVASTAESFKAEMLKLGAVQRVNILTANETELVVDIGECIYAPATTIIRGGDPNMIPPCPMMAILYSAIKENTGKDCVVTKCEFFPELNASTFTVTLE